MGHSSLMSFLEKRRLGLISAGPFGKCLALKGGVSIVKIVKMFKIDKKMRCFRSKSDFKSHLTVLIFISID